MADDLDRAARDLPAVAERNRRLGDTLERACDLLDAVDLTAWKEACDLIQAATPPGSPLAGTLFTSHRRIARARAILAGAREETRGT